MPETSASDAALAPDPALDQLSDDELLARCRQAAPGGGPGRGLRCPRPAVHAAGARVRAAVPGQPGVGRGPDAGRLIGLLKAIGDYDPAFGNGLRSYAAPCITGEIKRHFRDKRWQVRVTRPVQELLLELRGVTEDLTSELGRQPRRGRAGRAARRHARGTARGPAGGRGIQRPVARTSRSARPRTRPSSASCSAARTAGDRPRHRHGRGGAALGRAAPPRAADPDHAFLRQPHPGRGRGRLGLSQMHVSRLQARALARLREQLES